MWRDTSLERTHRPPDRDVEITDVKVTGVEGNPRDDGGYYVWGLVKVETDAGRYGIAETFRGEEALDAVRRMAPLVVGEHPFDTDRLTEHLNRHYTDAGGIGQSAITAIETACWDVKGKLLDVPVYELLGGAYRDEIVLYSDTEALAGDEEGIDLGVEYAPEAYARAARDVVDQGFEIIKFDLDVPTPGRPGADTASRRFDNHAVDHKVRLVEAVREAIGPDVELGMDLHWMLTVESAVRLGRKLEPYDLSFLEDPVHPRKLDAQVRVRERLPMPILGGENLTTKADVNEQVAAGAFDVAAPDVSMCGGLTELRKIAAICDVYGVPLAPHNLASPVGTMAGVHLAASIPNFHSLEFRGGDCPWWDDVVTRTGGGGPILEDGRIELPEGPGLGIEPNEAVVVDHLAEGYEYVF